MSGRSGGIVPSPPLCKSYSRAASTTSWATFSFPWGLKAVSEAPFIKPRS